jgi:hypothetical protein
VVDAKTKQDIRIAILRIFPLMAAAGVFVIALRYAIREYLGVRIPNLAYLGLLTALFAIIHMRYRPR